MMMRYVLLILVVACGKGKDDYSSEAMAEACAQDCEAQSKGVGCDSEAVLSECKGLCSLSSAGVAEECRAIYIDNIDCWTDADYSCDDSNFSFNGVDFPAAVVSESCEPIVEEYTTCANQ